MGFRRSFEVGFWLEREIGGAALFGSVPEGGSGIYTGTAGWERKDKLLSGSSFQLHIYFRKKKKKKKKDARVARMIECRCDFRDGGGQLRPDDSRAVYIAQRLT